MIHIIGKRSNLSRALSTALKDCVLVSASDVLSGNFGIEEGDTVILNNFQKATMLGDISTPIKYIEDSILSTATVLEKIKNSKPNKIIYTGSASVYGNNIYCKEEDTLEPLSLHAALKVANEKLVEKFCLENSIDFTITRVFNMYGGDDQFSVISKILSCAKEDREFTIVNNGNAIRDFIHIDDVVSVYMKLLDAKDVRYLNVASGIGVSIGQMVDFLKLNGVALATKVIYKDELKVSTASTQLLSDIVKMESFKSVYEFMREVSANGVK